MKGLPRELDELMWILADRNDAQAIESFGNRYPEQRAELAYRLNLARKLRTQRPAADANMPLFSPRVPVRARRPRWIAVAAAFASAVIVYAGYAVGNAWIVRSEPKVASVTEGKRVLDSNLSLGVEQSAQTRQTPLQTAPDSRLGKDVADAPAPRQPKSEPYVSTEPKISIRSEPIPLHQALKQIASLGGYTLELAPKLENEPVELNIVDQSALQAIEDLGSKFGFTAFDQGGRRLLIIPARAPSEAGPAGSREEPTSKTPGN